MPQQSLENGNRPTGDQSVWNQPMDRRTAIKRGLLGVALLTGIPAVIAACSSTAATPEPIDYDKLAQAIAKAQASTGANATDTAAATAAATAEPSTAINGTEFAEGQQLAEPILIPSVISGAMVRAFADGFTIEGNSVSDYQEGQWFLTLSGNIQPLSKNPTPQEVADHWKPIGPWCPVAMREVDSNSAHLSTHGNVGETIITADNGGRVEFAVMQLGPHQNDGKKNGLGQENDNWTMQYTFKGLVPDQEVIPVNPDTGKQLLWDDGVTPIVYKASQYGDFSVELPKTDTNQDVRVGFVFNMEPSANGVQAHEVKVERGPNDHPTLNGENVLPKSVIKPAVKS